MKTLVTGATGFVGRHLVEALRNRDHSVRILIRNPQKAGDFSAEVETVTGDICDRAALEKAVDGRDVLYHCAAATAEATREEIHRVNLEGLRTLLEVVGASPGKRLVLMSGLNVLGTRNFHEGAEDLPCRKANEPHGDAKIDGERLALEYHRDHDVDLTILRPGLIYGVGDRHLLKLARAIRRGKFVFIGSRHNVVPLVEVSDMVQALMLAGETPRAAGRIYHITDGRPTTIGELVDCIADMLEVRRPKTVLPYFLPSLVCRLFELLRKKGPINRTALRFLGTSRYASIQRAREELGYAPRVEFHEGLEHIRPWLVQESNRNTHADQSDARPVASAGH